MLKSIMIVFWSCNLLIPTPPAMFRLAAAAGGKDALHSLRIVGLPASHVYHREDLYSFTQIFQRCSRGFYCVPAVILHDVCKALYDMGLAVPPEKTTIIIRCAIAISLHSLGFRGFSESKEVNDIIFENLRKPSQWMSNPANLNEDLQDRLRRMDFYLHNIANLTPMRLLT